MNNKLADNASVKLIQTYGSDSLFRIVFVPGLFGDVGYLEPLWKGLEGCKCEIITMEDSLSRGNVATLDMLAQFYRDSLNEVFGVEDNLTTIYLGFCIGGAVSHACASFHQRTVSSQAYSVLISSPPSPHGSREAVFESWVDFMYSFFSGGSSAHLLDLDKKVFRIACFMGFKEPEYNKTLDLGRTIVKRSLDKYIACESYVPSPVPKLLYLASQDTGRKGFEFWASEGGKQSSYVELQYMHRDWMKNESFELLASALMDWCKSHI